MSQCDETFDLQIYIGPDDQINVGHDDQINVGHEIFFALYFQHFLMDEHHTFGIWVSVSQPLTSK